jgi:hypothetical protein
MDERPNNKRHKKSPTSCSNIISEEIFHENFKDIKISTELLKPANDKWNNEAGREKIFGWINYISFGIAECYKLIPIDSESSLHPYILEVIKPLAELSSALTIKLEKKEIDGDILEEACTAVAENMSRNSTKDSSNDIEVEEGSSTKLDATNPDEIKNIYIKIEEQLKSSREINGRVEFAIYENDKIKILIEAKKSINEKKGFWQTCSELVVTSETNIEKYKSGCIKGIYTDFGCWQFLEFDVEKKEIKKSLVYPFLFNKFQFDAYQVVMFLFEFFQISPNIDIPGSLENIKASTSAKAETLMTYLQENRRISEENRRISEENRIMSKTIRMLEQKSKQEEQNKRGKL